VEAWLDDPEAKRGKTYLTSFGRDLPEEDAPDEFRPLLPGNRSPSKLFR
jgi:hypothetical protein